jgi:hypothetical protein
MRPRAADAALDRADLALGHRRGLGQRHSIGPDQQDGLALMGGQLRQRGSEIHRDLPSFLVWRRRGAFEMAGARDLAAGTLPAIDIHETIAQDRGQPGAKIGAHLEMVEVGPGAEQRILDEVVGLIGAAAQRHRECAQFRNSRHQIHWWSRMDCHLTLPVLAPSIDSARKRDGALVDRVGWSGKRID